MSGEIDFRWGMPSLDISLEEGTTVPGFVLKHYAAVGVSIQEMMFIIHLSAYHFNSPQGRARPSLATIARLMGYKKDESVRRMAKSLEQRRLLRIERRVGQCSTYDFQGLSQACFAIEVALRSPTPVGDIPPTPVGDSDASDSGVPPARGGGPSHANGGPGLPSQGETPPHAKGGKESEQNENHQESEGKKEIHQVPGDAPAGDDGDDEALVLIQAELQFLGLSLDQVAGLRAGGDARALALIWQAHKGTNPAGLLIHLLQTGQSPPDELLERAKRMLAGEPDPYQAALEVQAAANPPPPPLPPPRIEPDVSLDAPAGSSRLTWREVWLAVRNQLELQLNARTFEVLRDARPVGFADGVLTVQVRRACDVTRLEAVDPVREHVKRLTGQPITVRYVTAEPEVVHA